MSKTPKTVYDTDKSAGNDPSKNYLIPTQDEANPTAEIVLDMDQIASAVSTRIGVSPPPETSENLAQLVITIQDNTLTPNLRTITGIDYTHYAVVTDDDTEPTYPDDFTNGPAPALLEPLAGWAAETKYVYLYDLPTTTLKTLTAPDGTSGIVVTPVWTFKPNWTTATQLSLSDGTDPNTQIKYVFGDPNPPTTSNSIVRYDLYQDVSGITTKIVDDISPTSTPTDISYTFSPNTPYTLFVRAVDDSVPALTSDSIPAVHTTAGADARVISISATPTAVEEGNDSSVVFSITGRTAAVDVDFLFQTYPQTAKDQVNYRHRGEITMGAGELTRGGAGNLTATFAHTGIGVTAGEYVKVSGANESEYNGTFEIDTAADSDTLTYTMTGDPGGDATGIVTVDTGVIHFPSGDNSDVTIDIETIDADETTNKVFETHLRPGTGTNNAVMDSTALSAHAVLNKVNGTGSTSSNIQADTMTLAGVASKQLFLLTDDHTTISQAGSKTGMVWTSTADFATLDAVEQALWNDPPTNYYTASDNSWYTTGVTDLTVEAGRRQWTIDIGSGESGYYSAWTYTHNRGGSGSDAHYVQFDGGTPFGTLSPGSVGNSYIDPANYGVTTGTWGWAPVGNDSPYTPLTINLTEGTHTVELYPLNPNAVLDVVAVMLHNEPTYDPETDATTNETTLSQSSVGVSVIEDDGGNPSSPTGPTYPGTITSTTLTPANGATGVQTTATIEAVFPGVTGIQIVSGDFSATGDGSAISGTVSSNGVDTITFTPSSQYPNDVTIAVTLSGGSAVDTDGVRKSLAIGTWEFDTIVTGGAVLFYENNNTIPLGSADSATLAPYYDVNGAINFVSFGNQTIVSDPDPLGTALRMLRSTVPANQLGEGMQMRVKPSASSATMHLYFDFYLPNAVPINKTIKIGGIFAYDESVPGSDNNVVGAGDSTLGFSARLFIRGPGAIPSTTIPGGAGENALGVNVMTQDIQQSYIYGRDIVCKYPAQTKTNGSGTWVGLIPGRHNTVEIQVTRNTTPGNVSGSELKVWVNGYLGIDLADDIMWNSTGQNYTPNMTWMDTYHGGGDLSFTSPEDRSYYFDEWTIKTSRIGTVTRAAPKTS